MKKPLHSAPMRLQRMKLQLQRYNFKLVYKAGKELHIADTLSRAYLPKDDSHEDEEEFEVLELTCISKRRADQIREAIQESEEQQELMKYILSGWPSSGKNLSAKSKPYYAFRDELAIVDGIIVKQQRVVIPKSLQKEYLDELHRGHPCKHATKARALDTVYWTGINEDIEKMTARCTACNKHKPRQQKEPMMMHEIPILPCEIVATDLFEWQSQMYLVTVDSYSGFYDIDKLSDTSSNAVIMKLKKQFATHGVPRSLISDNGPQFKSQAFSNFAKLWGFEHITSSPRYPQSNGLAERAVRSAKNLMTKCAEDNTDPYLALLMVRNTPRPGLQSSAERLFSRRTRSTLPTSEATLKPRIVNNVSENLRRIGSQKKQYYDKTAKPLTSLKPQDTVRIETEKGFTKIGRILQRAERPRGFIVESEGATYERNRKHLLRVDEDIPDEPARKQEANPDEARDEFSDNSDEGEISESELGEEETESESDEEEPKGAHALENFKRSSYGRLIKHNSKYKDFVQS